MGQTIWNANRWTYTIAHLRDQTYVVGSFRQGLHILDLARDTSHAVSTALNDIIISTITTTDSNIAWCMTRDFRPYYILFHHAESYTFSLLPPLDHSAAESALLKSYAMKSTYLQLLSTKYQRLTRYIHTLMKTGGFHSLSVSQRLSLMKRWLRYHSRMARWRPQAIGALGIGMYMLFTSSTFHHFTPSPDPTPFGLSDVGYFSSPTFVDIDGDGDLDAFVGESDGNINFFRNNGSSTSPNLVLDAASAAPFGLTNVDDFSVPTFADIDGDLAMWSIEVGHLILTHN